MFSDFLRACIQLEVLSKIERSILIASSLSRYYSYSCGAARVFGFTVHELMPALYSVCSGEWGGGGRRGVWDLSSPALV